MSGEWNSQSAEKNWSQLIKFRCKNLTKWKLFHLRIIYFSVIDFKVNSRQRPTRDILSTSCNLSTHHTVKKKKNYSKTCLYFVLCNKFEFIFSVSYLQSLLTEVTLFVNGTENIVPIKPKSHSTRSQLSTVSLVQFRKEAQGTKKFGLS